MISKNIIHSHECTDNKILKQKKRVSNNPFFYCSIRIRIIHSVNIRSCYT